MYSVLFCVLFTCLPYTLACDPRMSVPANDKLEGSVLILDCFINACSTDADFLIKWKKKQHNIFEDQFVYDSRTGDNTPDGELIGRANGSFDYVIHSLNVNPLRVEDSGNWICEYDDFSKSEASEEQPLQVLVIPSNEQIIIDSPSDALVTQDVNYVCSVDKVKPEFTVQWSRNGTDLDGDITDNTMNLDGLTWKFTSSVLVPFENVGVYELICEIKTSTSNMNYERVKQKFTAIKAPAKVERISGTEGEIGIADTLNLTCEATGSDVSITWYLNDKPLSDNKYDISEANKDGLYDYGQTTAKLSTLTWISLDASASCETISNFTGEYKCQANAFGDTQIQSEEKSIVVSYSPRTQNGKNDKEQLVRVGNSAEIDASMCAHPTIDSYLWSIDSIDKPSDITGWDSPTLVISKVSEAHIGRIFTCNASNNLGFGTTSISLAIDTRPEPLSGGIIAAIVISVIVVVVIVCFIVFFVMKKKKQQKADEEVVAYAQTGSPDDPTPSSMNGANTTTVQGNTTAVYAEVNKDKKKTSPTVHKSGAPVYSEVNKDKNKKTKTDESTGPVYSQVNKPGHRPLPQLKSKSSINRTNTGPVYSEDNKPKQGRLTPIEAQHHGGGNVYEEAGYIGGKPLPPINARHYDNVAQRNEHGGLHYADVDFLRQGKGETKQSYGAKHPSYEPTEYAKIDHRKSAGHVV